MATPQIPPRPTRSQHATAATAADDSLAAPRIPPRPSGRHKDRSISPDRYAPSPLNNVPRKPSSGGLYNNAHGNRSASSIDSPARPPSVTLPSIGQEGNEYGDLERHGEEPDAPEKTDSEETAAQMTHISLDLPLHAPKPSLSKSGARAQVAAVTRTDSNQAAAAGFSTPVSPREELDPYNRSLKSKTSSTHVRPPSSAASDRPGSASIEEQGIPHIGRYVPMLPNAGDVQAPSPGPGAQLAEPPEIRQRHHGRKHSGREIFHGPPGSYGLHGHGVTNADKFEKSWYAKHPEELAKEEHGHYSPALTDNRPEWALSSDDLNKIVQGTAKGAGFGTSANIVGLPNEQIGYLASDEFAQRLNSPRSPTAKHHKRSASQPHVESPLRQEAFPQEGIDRMLAQRATAERAVEGDNEEVIHIDPPEDSVDKVTGEGVEHKDFYNRRTSSDADGAFAEEHGYSAPILASDEVNPGGEWQQPAVSPGLVPDRRGSAQFDDVNHLHRHLSHLGSATSSRPGSRPGSIHGLPQLTKMISHDEHEERHTPLENVEEYEPLFPDDDGNAKKPMTQAERLKRRPDMKQRFPSQDIWEDTPNSLQLEAEVTSPEPFDERSMQGKAVARPVFETPDQEAARKAAAGTGNENNLTLTPTQELLAKAGFKQSRGKVDGSAIHRFPSRDIWEDSPDHAELTTTVDGPQEEEEATKEATGVHPRVPPRPTRTKSGDVLDNNAHPKVPPRPPRKQASTDSGEGESRKPPSIPDRPKPNVPLRPNKSTSRDSNENAPLTKTVSAGSTGSIEEDGARQAKPAPPIKPKPMVPSRSAGGKIAALQAGFMADLNSRLKVGPREQQPAPKAEEPPEEKAPLQDARKGRARGPARRKPAAHSASPQPAAAKGSQLSLSAVWTVWQSDPHGQIEVSAGADSHGSVEEKKIELAESANHPKVIDEGPVVEEPHAISKQNSVDINDAAPTGDNEPGLPVHSKPEGVIVEGSEPPAPTASETTPAPANPAVPSSIAADDSHTGLGGAQAGNVKAVPDADEVAKAPMKDSTREVEAETGQESPVKKPDVPRRTTDEVLMQAESAKDEHIEAEN